MKNTSLAKRTALSTCHEVRSCKLCKNPFETNNRSKRYCDACTPSVRDKATKKPKADRACAACGKSFKPRNVRFRVCSMECSIEYKRKMKNKPLTPRPCRHCGTVFTPRGNHRACYCSAKCGNNAGSLRAKERAKGGSTGRAEARCAKCDKPFAQYNSMHVYCDDCSPSKKLRNQEITRICSLCNEPFLKSGKGCHTYCAACREKYPKSIPHQSKAPCETCGKRFTHINAEARFCSHSCCSVWLQRAGLGNRHDDDALLAHLIKVIQNYDYCLSIGELVYLAGTSSVVLALRGWTMEILYHAAGRIYGPPRLYSRFEDRVYEVLCSLVDSSEIEVQKKLPGMCGRTGRELLVDFYINDLRLIIEADGNHHQLPQWGPLHLEKAQANDGLKDEYAKTHGISMVRIKETVDHRAIRAQLLRTIRRLRPRPGRLNPSNHLQDGGNKRRMIRRGKIKALHNSKNINSDF